MTPLYDLIKQLKNTTNPVTSSSLKECIRSRLDFVTNDTKLTDTILGILKELD